MSEFRYAFLVRQGFGQPPRVDSFHEISLPSDITAEQAELMQKLDPSYLADEIETDSRALKGMDLRLRFNQDMFPKICMVTSPTPIEADDLDSIIKMRFEDNTLHDFLKAAAIGKGSV